MRYRVLLLAMLTAALPAAAQEASRQGVQRRVTAADYARAEQFLRANTDTLVFGATVRPTWLSADRFWYNNQISGGSEFILVDPRARTRTRAFDHVRLAAALSAESDTTYDALQLPFTEFAFSADGRSIEFEVGPRHFTCDAQGNQCTAERLRGPRPDRNAVLSPDSTTAAFIRDHNLWVRDLTTGSETQLTTDGVEDFGYATNNAGWTKSDRPVLLWSPDSKKIATFQHDGRGVGEMYLVTTEVGHPTLEAWKYPLPEDSVIFRIHRVVIHLDGPRVVRLQMPPDQHRSTICDHIACRGAGFSDIEWSPDASQLAFVSTSRDHKHEVLRVADPETGTVRDVMEETVETFFESGFNMVNWHFLPASNEVIWFSQRDDWGHLYLYDLETGQLKNRITSGDWTVLQLLRIDEGNRMLYFTAAGREAGDPYFQYLYSIRMDGRNLTLLTPDSANHTIAFSPSGQYFLDSYSTPVVPPVAVVRDTRGRSRLTVEEADISRLVAVGWQPPIPITVKARDGTTDLYGLMYQPTNFDPNQKYPIVNYIYPGPQTGSVGSRSFNPSRGDKQSIAELGFVVVEIDAMGTPMRSKSFHAAYYGDMGDNGLPDQIAGMKELARRHPWLDIDRVGIYGHSGGGFASTDAILRYPDFFDVAVSGAGNHDNRNYEDDWGEKWQGLLETYPDSTTNYDNQANQLLAKNLKGKLLIAHGTMDSNVPPYNTLVVVDALIAANKDFDLILFPNRGHGFGNEPYMMRRRWDYFVRHLLGAEPPQEYQFQVDAAPRRPPM
ncbi:MAG: peptidase S9 [Gemmatimonas sp. SG8_17]|nr:MAG: peptidase S9 [Gemmatimonas sp. SG8_17]